MWPVSRRSPLLPRTFMVPAVSWVGLRTQDHVNTNILPSLIQCRMVINRLKRLTVFAIGLYTVVFFNFCFVCLIRVSHTGRCSQHRHFQLLFDILGKITFSGLPLPSERPAIIQARS